METSSQVSNLRNQITFKYDSINAILAGRSMEDLNSDEANRANRLMSEIEVLDLRASHLEMSSPTSRPLIDLEGGPYRSSKGPFKKFGDQLQAIRAAGMEGTKPDHRLFEVRAATGLSETVPSDGGFLVQTDFSTQILQSAFEVGKIAPLCHQIPISSGANGIKINAVAETSRVSSRWGGLVSYWTAESGTKIPSMPKFRQMELSLKKLIVLAYCSDEVLGDALLLEQVIREGFQHELSFTLDEVCLNGTGVGQPLGIMQSNCLIPIARQTPATITIQDLANIWGRCLGQTNAVWLVNPNTLPTMFQMALTIGASGIPVYMPATGISQSPFNTLFGRPVIPSEHCATLGTKGDIVLGDFSQYLLAMKSGGTVFSSSMHVRFVNDESVFRAVLRVDGQPVYNTAIQPKYGSTLSPFVCLAT